MIKVKQICQKCGKEFEIECKENLYKKGLYRKYCSKSCASSHILSDQQKLNISNGLKNSKILHQSHIYTCNCCGKEFISERTFREGRKIHCNDCIQQRKHSKDNLISILDCSKRTISKILKRSNKGCAICGWNESTCDIHHIIPKSVGGTNDNSNLILVCPNCHRVIHTTNKYDNDFLIQRNLINTFDNWKEFYHPSN